ncbi:MAG: endonuclease/exonuclease/phosphatase family protein [Myxococcota bacterium]
MRPWMVLAVVWMGGWAGCGGDGDGQVELPRTASFATWNVGLAYNFVPLATERRQAVFDAVAGIDADVVCLNEVWLKEDLQAIEAAAKAAGFQGVFYNYTQEDIADLPVACTEGDTKDLGPCATTNCQNVVDLVGCVTTQCKASFEAISSGCLTCLASNLDKNIDGILNACAKGGGKYSYGGANGLMLLTRAPMTEPTWVELKSSLIARDYLRAKVTPQGRPLDVYCTHLTATMAAVQYPGEFGSYAAEQAQQIDALVADVTARSASGGAVVLGDTNCGIANGSAVSAELPENFARFTVAGFSDPFASSAGATCSFCNENPLVASGADKGSPNVLIDHVLLHGVSGSSKGQRILQQPVTVEVNGVPQTTNLSDHFGLRVEVDFAK